MKLEYHFVPLKNGAKIVQKLIRNDYHLEIGNVWIEEQKKTIKVKKTITTPIYGDFRKNLYEVVKEFCKDKNKRVIMNENV